MHFRKLLSRNPTPVYISHIYVSLCYFLFLSTILFSPSSYHFFSAYLFIPSLLPPPSSLAYCLTRLILLSNYLHSIPGRAGHQPRVPHVQKQQESRCLHIQVSSSEMRYQQTRPEEETRRW